MKTAQQIIGLPVISISDGNEIGKVKNVIINAAKGTVDFFIIDSGVRSLAGGVIPAARVLGIGEYALTIQEPDDISDIVKIPAAIELLQKNITVNGTRVLTKKGSLLGEAGDIHINEEDASYGIVGVDFIPGKDDIKSGIIPRSSIITFGKNLLVVNDDFLGTLKDTSTEVDFFASDEKKNSNSIASEDAVASLDDGNKEIEAQPVITLEDDSDTSFTIIPADDLPVIEDSLPEPIIQTEEKPVLNEQEMSASELFEYRQKQYLIGKKVSKTIYSNSGSVIVTAGEIITDAIVDEVKQNGKLIELVMNYEG
jgi:uncharacterized protein YrrD